MRVKQNFKSVWMGEVKMSWNEMTMKRPSSVIIRYRPINSRETHENID